MLNINNNEFRNWLARYEGRANPVDEIGLQDFERFWAKCQKGTSLIYIIAHTGLAHDRRLKDLALQFPTDTPDGKGLKVAYYNKEWRKHVNAAREYHLGKGDLKQLEELIHEADRAFDRRNLSYQGQFFRRSLSIAPILTLTTPHPGYFAYESAKNAIQILLEPKEKEEVIYRFRVQYYFDKQAADAWQAKQVKEAFQYFEVLEAAQQAIKSKPEVPWHYSLPKELAEFYLHFFYRTNPLQTLSLEQYQPSK